MEFNTRWGQPRFFFSNLYFQSKFSLYIKMFKACRRHKKVLTFSKIGCRCHELFSHLFTPSEIFFNITRVGGSYIKCIPLESSQRELSFETIIIFFEGVMGKNLKSAKSGTTPL